jgi:hypothetical protein
MVGSVFHHTLCFGCFSLGFGGSGLWLHIYNHFDFQSLFDSISL